MKTFFAVLLLSCAALAQNSGQGSLDADYLSNPRACVPASASGTAYTCSTNPKFTPATHDEVIFKADVANTGSATLAVNGASAATIKKQGGGTNLVANDLLIGTWTVLIFDGTNWQMQGLVGNAASGGTVALTALAKVASYTLLSGDFTTPSAVTFTCTAACVATLPSSAPTTGSYVTIQNATRGTAANFSLTVYPNGLTLNGAALPLIIGPGNSVLVESDGSNYQYLGQGVTSFQKPDSRPTSYWKSACSNGVGLVGPGIFFNNVNNGPTVIAATSSEPCYYDWASATSASALSGYNEAGNQEWFFGSNIVWAKRVELKSTVTQRDWFVLSNQQTSTVSASDTPVGPAVGFRYSTNASDTNWMACSSVNSGTNMTCTSTGVAIGTTGVVLKIVMADNLATPAVLFFINGALTNTLTTAIPASVVAAEDIVVLNNLASGVAESVRASWGYIESDKY